MKYSILLVLLLVTAACGKNQGSSGTSDKQEQQRGFIDLAAAEALPDLLNAVLDMPIELAPDRVIFLKNGTVTDQGLRKNCSLSVKQGESWFYSARGNNMTLDMANGQRINMVKQSSTGAEPQGVWIGRTLSNQMKMIYRFTIFHNRMILNQDCEG